MALNRNLRDSEAERASADGVTLRALYRCVAGVAVASESGDRVDDVRCAKLGVRVGREYS